MIDTIRFETPTVEAMPHRSVRITLRAWHGSNVYASDSVVDIEHYHRYAHEMHEALAVEVFRHIYDKTTQGGVTFRHIRR